MPEEYISFNEARGILGLDEDSLLDLIVDGQITNRKIDGENRLLASDVEACRLAGKTGGGNAVEANAVTIADEDVEDGGRELDTLELMDDEPSSAPAPVAAAIAAAAAKPAASATGGVTPGDVTLELEEDDKSGNVTSFDITDEATSLDDSTAHTEVLANDRTGASSTPLRTEELFFEDDDLGSDGDTSRTQDVTVIEEAVATASPATADAVAVLADDSAVTEEFAPEETARDVAARKRGGRAPSPVRRSSVATSGRRGGYSARSGAKKTVAAGGGDMGWTAVVAITALLAAWPLAMMISLAANPGGYTNSDTPISTTTRIPDYLPNRQMVEVGSDLMGMWKADMFQSVREVFVGRNPVLSVSGERLTVNSGEGELFGRPELNLNAIEDDYRPKPATGSPLDEDEDKEGGEGGEGGEEGEEGQKADDAEENADNGEEASGDEEEGGDEE